LRWFAVSRWAASGNLNGPTSVLEAAKTSPKRALRNAISKPLNKYDRTHPFSSRGDILTEVNGNSS